MPSRCDNASGVPVASGRTSPRDDRWSAAHHRLGHRASGLMTRPPNRGPSRVAELRARHLTAARSPDLIRGSRARPRRSPSAGGRRATPIAGGGSLLPFAGSYSARSPRSRRCSTTCSTGLSRRSARSSRGRAGAHRPQSGRCLPLRVRVRPLIAALVRSAGAEAVAARGAFALPTSAAAGLSPVEVRASEPAPWLTLWAILRLGAGGAPPRAITPSSCTWLFRCTLGTW